MSHMFCASVDDVLSKDCRNWYRYHFFGNINPLIWRNSGRPPLEHWFKKHFNIYFCHLLRFFSFKTEAWWCGHTLNISASHAKCFSRTSTAELVQVRTSKHHSSLFFLHFHYLSKTSPKMSWSAARNDIMLVGGTALDESWHFRCAVGLQ